MRRMICARLLRSGPDTRVGLSGPPALGVPEGVSAARGRGGERRAAGSGKTPPRALCRLGSRVGGAPRARARAPARVQTCRHKRARARTRTRPRSRTRRHPRAHTQTHWHAHARARPRARAPAIAAEPRNHAQARTHPRARALLRPAATAGPTRAKKGRFRFKFAAPGRSEALNPKLIQLFDKMAQKLTPNLIEATKN